MNWTALPDSNMALTSVYCDTGQIAKLFLHQWTRRLNFQRVLVALLDCRPIDVAHERVDIRPRVGAEVDVVSVLVHVEREDRDAAGHRLAMIGRVLVDEPAIARHGG